MIIGILAGLGCFFIGYYLGLNSKQESIKQLIEDYRENNVVRIPVFKGASEIIATEKQKVESRLSLEDIKKNEFFN
jgi:hypothetical protein